MSSPATQSPAEIDRDFIDKMLTRHATRPGAMLIILQQVQNNHPRRYLPLEALDYIATRTGVPLARIYSVATFYALFNLTPQGRNTISVCRGTACHTRGSRDLFEKVMMHLGFDASADGDSGQLSITTPDASATLRTVACFGQCALAPVIEINHAILGHVNEQTLHRELEVLDKR